MAAERRRCLCADVGDVVILVGVLGLGSSAFRHEHVHFSGVPMLRHFVNKGNNADL